MLLYFSKRNILKKPIRVDVQLMVRQIISTKKSQKIVALKICTKACEYIKEKLISITEIC
jgi:hypothetical protein